MRNRLRTPRQDWNKALNLGEKKAFMSVLIQLLNQKHREVVLYLFFGVLSFLISLGTYALLSEAFHMNVLIANIFAWILSVSFAYITNRIWVFESSADNGMSILREIGKFTSGRIATLAIEELILYIFITRMDWNSMFVKTMATIIVIILNYILSKAWIFRKQT